MEKIKLNSEKCNGSTLSWGECKQTDNALLYSTCMHVQPAKCFDRFRKAHTCKLNTSLCYVHARVHLACTAQASLQCQSARRGLITVASCKADLSISGRGWTLSWTHSCHKANQASSAKVSDVTLLSKSTSKSLLTICFNVRTYT